MIDIFKALGDENRLRILNLLIKADLCVCEIEVILDMSQSNVSRHLSKLKKTGIISSSKDAQWVHYKVSNEFVNNDKLLCRYLKEKFTSEDVFTNDVRRYQKYKENNMNCQWITENKDKVQNIIK
ncbi:winged helix-turn-helix transcriptional regulator [Clostridium sp. D2Q-11]|uniref:Winged helix-turn-helix transcriptional regulator n=1 Tax=Anaeromonas frigoriresistens TaxID=2683708 RepID=A0A942Z7R4_9FIRM|nr:metalloregulator ArsR/SmtB family transcription factor [Anaeromonas frigoriresistens]MBS4538987.1 winged helix-turn-helix transcriptional regulator [Anaeromonas frigoriresistens]